MVRRRAGSYAGSMRCRPASARAGRREPVPDSTPCLSRVDRGSAPARAALHRRSRQATALSASTSQQRAYGLLHATEPGAAPRKARQLNAGGSGEQSCGGAARAALGKRGTGHGLTVHGPRVALSALTSLPDGRWVRQSPQAHQAGSGSAALPSPAALFILRRRLAVRCARCGPALPCHHPTAAAGRHVAAAHAGPRARSAPCPGAACEPRWRRPLPAPVWRVRSVRAGSGAAVPGNASASEAQRHGARLEAARGTRAVTRESRAGWRHMLHARPRAFGERVRQRLQGELAQLAAAAPTAAVPVCLA